MLYFIKKPVNQNDLFLYEMHATRMLGWTNTNEIIGIVLKFQENIISMYEIWNHKHAHIKTHAALDKLDQPITFLEKTKKNEADGNNFQIFLHYGRVILGSTKQKNVSQP